MSSGDPVSLSRVLDFQASSAQYSLDFPNDICVGSVSIGGLVACVATKYAISYASQHPKMRKQTDVRSAYSQFYRPIFPKNGPVTMKLHEVNIGRGWSTIRIELFQGNTGKICASTDVLVSDFSIPGVTLQTGWQLLPPAHPVDLAKLEAHTDPEWICYHIAFHSDGFRRGQSYVKNFIPRHWPSKITYLEQWVTPGWDCAALGSRNSSEEGRWTNDMIQFAADSVLPVQENFMSSPQGQPKPLGSIAATLDFANTQKEARDRGDRDWRRVLGDGSQEFKSSLPINSTLSISIEIKKKLPAEGVRWLYLRSEAKRVQDSRMDLEVLVFDEDMDLVAISYQVVQLIPALGKSQRTSTI